ncbi:MAG: NUDIX hydrolase, partial [Nanoarchaeota archaeon]|nr:NUDIX hydrolase [Nanoarchaeota archaeon]
REMKEELNLEIKTLEKIGEMQNTWKGKEDLLHCFVCQVADDNIIMNKSEIKEAKWFPSEKLPILGPTSTKILKMWKEKI